MRTRRLRAAAAVSPAARRRCSRRTPAAACGPGAAGAQPSNVITVSSNQCGGTWSVPGPGWHTIQISNQGTGGAEIDLVDPANGAVYAEIENTGPGTVNPISIDFGSGKYALHLPVQRLQPAAGGDGHGGRARHGHAGGPAGHLQRPHPARQEVPGRGETALKVLAPETATLAAAVRGGNLAAARRDWLTAHLQYETLGDAYDAFGDFDTEIDGRADAPGSPARSGPGSTALSTGCGTGSPLASLVPVAEHAQQRRRPARRLVADAAGAARRPRAARPRGHRERARVPAHRARRLRQRHHAREHGRQHHRQPRAARACCTRCSRPGIPGCPRSTPG